MHRACGRRLSSAWRAMVLQLHLLRTWLCSLGVAQQQVRWCAERGGGARLLLRAWFVFALLRCCGVQRFCLPCDRFLSHARHCRWCCFQRCGCVQRSNRSMVNGSAQCGALCSCSCSCRELGSVRWGSKCKCVVVQGGERVVGVVYVCCVFCDCACCGIAVFLAM